MFSRNRGNSVPNAGKGAKQAEPQPVPNGRAREGSVPDLLAPPPSDAQPLSRSAPGSRDTSPKLTPTQTREASSAPASPGRLSRSAQPGHEGNLSPQQAEALEKLRTRLTDEGYLSKENAPHYQETQLLRFLRARSFNVDAEHWPKSLGGKCTCCADEQDEKRAAEAKENRCETSDDGPWASVFHHLRCRGQCP